MRSPLLPDRWKPALDAVEVLLGFGCILYALGQVHPMIALGTLGVTLTATGAFGIYRRGTTRHPSR